MTIFIGSTPSATAMTFLALVKRLGRECAINGNGPVTVMGQNAQMQRLVDWINTAWLEIQGLHDQWNFMREDFSFNTVAGVGDYPVQSAIGLTDHRYWHTETFRIFNTETGLSDEGYLPEWDYGTFRDVYRYGLQVPGRPCVFAVKRRASDVMLGVEPDREYTVRGEYQRSPTVMVLDDDYPSIPEHLHMIIVWKAMMHYGIFEASSEVVARAELQYGILLSQLEREELPDICMGEPFA